MGSKVRERSTNTLYLMISCLVILYNFVARPPSPPAALCARACVTPRNNNETCYYHDNCAVKPDVAPLAHPQLLARAEAPPSARRVPGRGGPAGRDILGPSHGRRLAVGAARLAARYALGPTRGRRGDGARSSEGVKRLRCAGWQDGWLRSGEMSRVDNCRRVRRLGASPDLSCDSGPLGLDRFGACMDGKIMRAFFHSK